MHRLYAFCVRSMSILGGSWSQSPADVKGRLICSSLSSECINKPTKPCVCARVCTGENTDMAERYLVGLGQSGRVGYQLPFQ